jgi:hypothetical protein
MLYAWAVFCLGVLPLLVLAIYLMDSWWYARNKPGR